MSRASAESDFLTLTAPGGDIQRGDLTPFRFGREEWRTLTFVNGRFDPELSDLDGLPSGVRGCHWTRLAEMPDMLERYVGKIAGFEEPGRRSRRSTRRTCGWGRGPRSQGCDGGSAESNLLFVSDAMAARGVMYPATHRHGAQRQGNVLETYAAIGDAHYFTNVVTEVAIADGATLTHVKLQRESQRAYHVGTVDVRQARDSHYVSFSFGTGAALSRSNVYTVLGGEGCGATLNGLYMLDGDQHMDHQTRIEHAEPNCYSREVYKGVLDGTSHGVFNGKVYVHPVAQRPTASRRTTRSCSPTRLRSTQSRSSRSSPTMSSAHTARRWDDSTRCVVLHEEPRYGRGARSSAPDVRLRGRRDRDTRGRRRSRGLGASDAGQIYEGGRLSAQL